MKNKKILLISTIIILISSIMIGNLIIKKFTTPISTEIVEFEIKIKEGGWGFNTDTDKLYFGKISPGSSSNKELTITNKHQFNIKIKYYYSSNNESNISKYIFTTPFNEPIIKPGENLTFKISLNIPEEMEEGDYSGNIIFSTYVAKPWENRVNHYRRLGGCFNEGDFWEITGCKD